MANSGLSWEIFPHQIMWRAVKHDSWCQPCTSPCTHTHMCTCSHPRSSKTAPQHVCTHTQAHHAQRHMPKRKNENVWLPNCSLFGVSVGALKRFLCFPKQILCLLCLIGNIAHLYVSVYFTQKSTWIPVPPFRVQFWVHHYCLRNLAKNRGQQGSEKKGLFKTLTPACSQVLKELCKFLTGCYCTSFSRKECPGLMVSSTWVIRYFFEVSYRGGTTEAVTLYVWTGICAVRMSMILQGPRNYKVL